MAVIDVGSAATDRSSLGQGNVNATFIDGHNPANGTGTLDTFEVYAVTGNNVTGLKVGTFSGSGTSWTYRDHELIGSVSAGSKQTFTGKSCDVAANDCLGWLITGGKIEQDVGGSLTVVAAYELSYDAFSSGAHTLNDNTPSFKLAFSIYATGTTEAGGSLPLKNVFNRPFSGVFR